MLEDSEGTPTTVRKHVVLTWFVGNGVRVAVHAVVKCSLGVASIGRRV
jgi:hypothetical protein